MQGSEKMEIRTTNALINEKSPYLLRRTFPATIKTTIQTKLLKAPLHSEVFEKTFRAYITEVKRDIREVTLWLKE